MFHIRTLCNKTLKFKKRFYSDYIKPQDENPVSKTLRTLGNDLKIIKGRITNTSPNLTYFGDTKGVSGHVDVLVIGGGAMGSSIAYSLRERAGNALTVAVVEKDPTYTKASTVLSVGGLRQQFSLPENILMSQYAGYFFRNVKKLLGEDVDLQFTPYGYLLLATEKTADQLLKNYNLQRSHNVKNELLSVNALKSKFPWLNLDGIVMGCHGLENEGWFDPWMLLSGFKNKALQLGTEYINGELIGFNFENQSDFVMEGVEPGKFNKLSSAQVKLNNSDVVTEIKFAYCILAAGASSGELAKLANIGTGKGLLEIPLPVEPRKRYVYCFSTQDKSGPGLNTPMTFDPSGTYFRREGLGNNYIGGKAPLPEDEPSVDNLDVDHNFFETDVWPYLAERVPAFSGVKVNSAWAGYYEFNTYDENGIIGSHPYYRNLIIATGFSGHGIQQAPAVGRGVAELIIDGNYTTIDLTRLGFDRMLIDRPMFETNIF